MALVALFALPQVAEARGRKRVVPNLQEQRQTLDASSKRTIATRIPVVVHLATLEGYDVVSTSRIGGWVERANQVFAPHGIELYVKELKRLPAGYTEIRHSKERRDLATLAPHDGSVHLFVVEALDLANPRWKRRRVRGLHWRYRGIRRQLRQREYVVVTRGAPDTTLAHEVGHLLGLRHSNAENNIMCSCRRGSRLGFSYRQGEEMRSGAQVFTTRHRNARRAHRRWLDRRRR